MSSVNKDDFISSFLIYLFLSCFIALARTFSTILKRSGERGNPCLVLDISLKGLSLSPLSIMLPVGIFVGIIYHFEDVPLYTTT